MKFFTVALIGIVLLGGTNLANQAFANTGGINVVSDTTNLISFSHNLRTDSNKNSTAQAELEMQQELIQTDASHNPTFTSSTDYTPETRENTTYSRYSDYFSN